MPVGGGFPISPSIGSISSCSHLYPFVTTLSSLYPFVAINALPWTSQQRQLYLPMVVSSITCEGMVTLWEFRSSQDHVALLSICRNLCKRRALMKSFRHCLTCRNKVCIPENREHTVHATQACSLAAAFMTMRAIWIKPCNVMFIHCKELSSQLTGVWHSENGIVMLQRQ